MLKGLKVDGFRALVFRVLLELRLTGPKVLCPGGWVELRLQGLRA